MLSRKYLCITISSLKGDGYIATTTDDIKNLHGEYNVATDDIKQLKDTLKIKGCCVQQELSDDKMIQLDLLKTLVIACKTPNGYNFDTVVSFAIELNMPLYHLILMEELCGHPYYFGKVDLNNESSSIRELSKRFLNFETKKIIVAQSAHKLMGYFEKALWDRYENKVAVSCDYMLLYAQRFNVLMDSLNESCY